jgi:hypothetical protein
MDLPERAQAVSTRDDLATFGVALREELLANPSKWENSTLDAYLEAFSAWCADMPGYFRNRGEQQPDQPSWNLIAQMLLAAALYE